MVLQIPFFLVTQEERGEKRQEDVQAAVENHEVAGNAEEKREKREEPVEPVGRDAAKNC